MNGEVSNSNIEDEEELKWDPPADNAERMERIEDLKFVKGAEVLNNDTQQARGNTEESTLRKLIIVSFLKGKTDKILYQTQDQYTAYKTSIHGEYQNPYELFKSKLDWEFVKWAKT